MTKNQLLNKFSKPHVTYNITLEKWHECVYAKGHSNGIVINLEIEDKSINYFTNAKLGVYQNKSLIDNESIKLCSELDDEEFFLHLVKLGL